MRVFFATDIHGSEVCWRKFLNAGKFHKADVLIMGGDMTGKAMVPIVARNGGWRLSLQDQEHVLSTQRRQIETVEYALQIVDGCPGIKEFKETLVRRSRH